MNNQLAHHGIKGQKWGIRRFQNEDGALTAAGKVRYADSSPTRGRNYKQGTGKAEKQGTVSGGPVGSPEHSRPSTKKPTIGDRYYSKAYEKADNKARNTGDNLNFDPQNTYRRDAIKGISESRKGSTVQVSYNDRVSGLKPTFYTMLTDNLSHNPTITNSGSGESAYNDAKVGVDYDLVNDDGFGRVATVVLDADTPLERIILKESVEAQVGGILDKAQKVAVSAIGKVLTKNAKVAKKVNSFLEKLGF